MSAAKLCEHVKTNGVCCQSPALDDERYCYFHRSSRERTKRQRRALRHHLPFQLPLLEDAEAIQLAIGDVLNAILTGQLDHKTASLLLYGLQTAAGNIRQTRFVVAEEHRRFEHFNDYEEASLESEIAREVEVEQSSDELRDLNGSAAFQPSPSISVASDPTATLVEPEPAVYFAEPPKSKDPLLAGMIALGQQMQAADRAHYARLEEEKRLKQKQQKEKENEEEEVRNRFANLKKPPSFDAALAEIRKKREQTER